MCQVHTGTYVSILAPEKPTIPLATQERLSRIYYTCNADQPVVRGRILSELQNFVAGYLLPCVCRKKAKRKRDEAEAEAAAVRAKEAANADDLSSGSATEDIDRDVDPRSSGSDGAGGDRNDSKDADSTSENIDDILTPAQRRFREKQLQREVRLLAIQQLWSLSNAGCPLQCLWNRVAQMGITSSDSKRGSAGLPLPIAPVFPSVTYLRYERITPVRANHSVCTYWLVFPDDFYCA